MISNGIPLKSASDIAVMREGGKRLVAIIARLVKEFKPGITAKFLDELALELIRAGGDRSAFLHYRPPGARKKYPATLCVSVNDEVVHGLPNSRIFQDGDLVSLDLGLEHGGFFVDMATTIPAGKASREVQILLSATQEALEHAIAAARSGKHLGDIGAAIERTASQYRLGLVTALGGHGVGRQVHEEPMIPNFGEPGTGPELVEGMVLAIEPMFTLGSGKVKFIPNNFAVTTADGSLAAHFEHTIAITKNGPEILTQT